MKHYFLSFLLAALCCAMVGTGAHAATFAVNTTNDTIDLARGDGVCADSADECSLRAAIQESDARAGADIITVPAGTFTLTLAGTDEDLAATGDLDITDDVTIKGAGALKTIVDANGIDRVFDVIATATATISGLTVTRGSGLIGGAIRTGAPGVIRDGRIGTKVVGVSLNLTNCAVTDSSTLASGGGIDHTAGGTLTLTGVTVSGCRAGGSGGGVHQNGGNLTATNCTFSGNFADPGSGVRVGVGKSATFLNCTVASNSGNGSSAGLVNDGGSVTLKNTLLAFNRGFSSGSSNYSGTGTSLGHNLSSDTTAAAFLTATGDRNNVNPRLLSLSNNGGQTQTHALRGDSPAVNAGDNSGAPPTDQRGVARPQGATVDIGAFEVTQSSGACSLTVTSTADGGPGSLRAAIDCANSTPGTNTITVPAGTYKLTKAGTDEDGNGTGDLDIFDNLILNGAGAATTIIDGNALDRVVDIKSVLQTPAVASDPNLITKVTISGVTVRNGSIIGDGGGIRSLGFLTLRDATVSGNTAKISADGERGGEGGGVSIGRIGFFTQPTTSLTVVNCQILNNIANNGGGLVGANNGGQDTLSVTGSTFTGNRASGSGGGGVANGGLLVMSGCTFTNNVADADNQDDSTFGDEGGGFASEGGDSTLTNCTFDNNKSGKGGGGGFENAGGNLSLAGCRFLNNKCGADSGAGFENEGGDLVMTDCVVTGNISTSLTPGDNDGGGGFENEGGSLVMTRCTITNNSVTGTGTRGEGGGGFENEGGSLTMTACVVSGNTTDGAGGGINNEGGETVITNCTISGNTAGGVGGGLNQEGGRSLTMTGCTVSGNTSLSDGRGGNAGTGQGGGIYTSADTTLTNCTISGNGAAEGGGIYFDRGRLRLLNVTIADNQSNANGGGGVFENGDDSAAINTIIARNTGSDCAGNGITNTSDNSLDSDGTCRFNGTGNLTADPKLAPLANNGGPTQTQVFLPGSPAIDAGTNTDAPATDQRGVARPIDGDRNGSKIVDIGAFETEPFNAAGSFQFSAATFSVNESGPTATITVKRVGASDGNVSVKFATSNGSAVAGSDYTAQSGTLSFASGETTKTFTVSITNDALDETNETVNLTLSAPTGGATLGSPIAATLTIQDNDATTISINDVSLAEGNPAQGAPGTKTFAFTVSLSNPSSISIAVNFVTQNGTASDSSDYNAGSGQVVFAPGETTKTIAIAVRGDTVIEANEIFFVNLTLPPAVDETGPLQPAPTVSDAQGKGTIINDDQPPAPALSINNVSLTEGNSGTTNAVLTVTLSSAAAGPVTVKFATASGNALAGADFVQSTGTLTIAAGRTTGTLIVPINGDLLDENDEVFVVNLSNATGATIGDGQARVTIVDNDTSSVNINDVRQTEGNAGLTNFAFRVTLSNPSATPVTVNFATRNGTALAGSDYNAINGQVVFAAGQTTKTINVSVRGDTQIEADETFTVNISFSSEDALTRRPRAVIGDQSGTATILNDDQAVAQRADLRVTQTVSSAQVAVGQNATFTITVTNGGPAIARSVVLTNTLPTGATFVSATPTPATNRNGVLTFNLGDLAVNASRTFRITVRLTRAGTVINRALATSPTSDPAQANNNSGAAVSTGAVNVTGQITVTRGALVIVGPYLPGLFGTGSRFRQVITVRNTGAALTGPLSLVLDNLRNARLLNASGITRNMAPGGSSFVNVNIGADNLLATGESVAVTLEFSTNRPTFTPRVLAGSGTR